MFNTFIEIISDPSLLISMGLIIVSDIVMFIRGKRQKARTSVDVQALLDQVSVLISLLKGEGDDNGDPKQSK